MPLYDPSIISHQRTLAQSLPLTSPMDIIFTDSAQIMSGGDSRVTFCHRFYGGKWLEGHRGADFARLFTIRQIPNCYSVKLAAIWATSRHRPMTADISIFQPLPVQPQPQPQPPQTVRAEFLVESVITPLTLLCGAVPKVNNTSVRETISWNSSIFPTWWLP